MKHLIKRVLGLKSEPARHSREAGHRRRRGVKPEVLGLEGRQLLSGFARSFEGGPANDMAVFRPSDSSWYIAKAGSSFNTNPQAQPVANQPGERGDIPIQNSDFFGNHRADLAVFRPSNGTWYIKDSVSGATIIGKWGAQGDVPLASSDFDGDGKADLAVWRPSTATWFVLKSSTGYDYNQRIEAQWGAQGDVPLASSDFDGDGKADLAVFRPSTSTWFVLKSSTGYSANQRLQTQWGIQGDVPIMNSDFDGDHKTDIAVWRPSTGTWFVLKSSTGYSANQRIEAQWGIQGDVPLASSDFDGDGKTDLAVYRPSIGTWFILKSSTGYSANQKIQTQWGTQGDMPLPNADFDGDGRADIAVFRPMDATWHVLTSASNFTTKIERQWGVTGDQAIPGADAPDPIANIVGNTRSATDSATVAGVTYRSFQGNPLFSSDGPSPDDVRQGQVGDCQTLAVLLGIAKKDPAMIRRMIVDMGNGTYAVDFKPMGIDHYVVVDATLPTDSNGNLIYARLGNQNSLWVALVEKAFTFERPVAANWPTPNGSYRLLDGGGSVDILGALGLNYENINSTDVNPGDLLDKAVIDFILGAAWSGTN